MRIKVLSGGRRNIELPLTNTELNFQMRRIGIEETVPMCRLVEVIEKDNPLHMLEGQTVNMDEVNYFAKRMESLTNYERKVLSAYASDYGVGNMQDLINLTFSMKGLSLLTDFSDAEQVGKRLYMDEFLAMSEEEKQQINFIEFAEKTVKKLCKIDKVVASLPYQITEPFIEKIKDIPCQSITLIVGATFAKNVTNTFLHSKLALLTNCYFSAIKICDVPEEAFLPPPKTLSSIIKLIPKSKKELVDEGGLYILREIFEQRDKKIKNALQYSIIRFYNIKGILLTKRKCKKILKEYLVTLRREDITLEQMTNKEIVAMYK